MADANVLRTISQWLRQNLTVFWRRVVLDAFGLAFAIVMGWWFLNHIGTMTTWPTILFGTVAFGIYVIGGGFLKAMLGLTGRDR